MPPSTLPPSRELIAHELNVALNTRDTDTLDPLNPIAWLVAGAILGVVISWAASGSISQHLERWLRMVGL